ncbi:protein NinF [Salmonella enterica]|nr:protein NinF [Salmonella enterica]
MLSPTQIMQYQKESVDRALTCANCGQKLHVLEVHVCEHCCAELMSDPNSSMHEEEDDEWRQAIFTEGAGLHQARRR